MGNSETPAPWDVARSRALRGALGMFVTGVTIVTKIDTEGRPRGLTANSFTSVSLDPPLVLACIARGSASYDTFQGPGGFAINVLSDAQRELSDLFASKSPDKFAGLDYRLGIGGAPVIDASLAWLDCETERIVEAGDHIILIGRVADFGTTAGRPLAFCQGAYLSFDAEQDAVFRPQGKSVTVDCIADFGGAILLRAVDVDGTRKWTLPGVALARGERGGLTALTRFVEGLGTAIDVSFIYSVYETPHDDAVHIVYRGTLTGAPVSAEVRLFAEDEMPWDDLVHSQIHDAVERYFKERAFDQFGVYVDMEEGGHVAPVSQKPQAWSSYVSDLDK